MLRQYPPYWQIGSLEVEAGAALGDKIIFTVGLGDGADDGTLVIGGEVDTELLLLGGAPYPVGLRQLGAAGCTHCRLLQTAPGSQQSDGVLHGLP